MTVNADLPPERDATPDEAFDLGRIAGYDEAMREVSPRVVSTVAELDALPHGSVIRCNLEGQAALVIGTKAPRDFYMAGRAGGLPADAVRLPATVLYTPSVVKGKTEDAK